MCNNNKKCSCSCKKNKFNETVLLQEVINLEISSSRKIEALKQARVANEAILSLYELCQKSGVKNPDFLSILDKAYSNTNALLTVLVVQNEKDESEEQKIPATEKTEF